MSKTIGDELAKIANKPFEDLKREYIGKEVTQNRFTEEIKERFNLEDQDIVYDKFDESYTVEYEKNKFYIFKTKEEKGTYFNKRIISGIYQDRIATVLPLAKY